MRDGPAGQIAELERRIHAGADGEERVLLAELLRREGRLAEAERRAREALARAPASASGLAVLALVLLDAGRATEARIELEESAAGTLTGWSAAGPADRDVRADARLSEDELERAFDAAEPQLDQMITPDRLAEEAALRVDGSFDGAGASLEEPVADTDADDGADEASSGAEASELLGLGGAFSTRTMAELLEQQGDVRGAERIRAALGAVPVSASAASMGPAVGRHARVIAVLERWLENVRRHSA